MINIKIINDIILSLMYEAPREDQTHYSVVHDMQDKLVKKN